MTSKTTLRTSFLVAGSIALLGACGGGSASEPDGEQSSAHEGGEHEHSSMPAEVDAFHSTLAPAWHSEAGASRAAEACTAAPALQERAVAVQGAAAPGHVDAAAWATAVGQLVTTTDALVAECTAAGPDAEAALSSIHDAFHGLVDQLAADRR